MLQYTQKYISLYIYIYNHYMICCRKDLARLQVWDCLQIPPILGSDTQDARDAAAAVLLDGALVAWLARGFDHER